MADAEGDYHQMLTAIEMKIATLPEYFRQVAAEPIKTLDSLIALLDEPSGPAAAPERCTCTPFTNPSTYKIDPRCPEHGHSAAEQPGNDPKEGVMPNAAHDRMSVSTVSSSNQSDPARGSSERAEGNEKAVFNIRCHKHADIALLCRKCVEEGIVDVDKAFGEGPAAPTEELRWPWCYKCHQDPCTCAALGRAAGKERV